MKILAYLPLLLLLTCRQAGDAQHDGANHLIHESSPYLLQHAHNPVDWHPWKEEALAKAKSENKMLLISIGYAACHWCHVMEAESFEDSTVAALMNEHFVNIKVDREERPDVDNLYLTACQLSTGGNCGWPLNVFALPDGRPVWAGTYFPKKEWLRILDHFAKTYSETPDKLEAFAAQLLAGIKQVDQVKFNDSEPDFQSEQLDRFTGQLLRQIDFKKGGLEGAPKFPLPNLLSYLLKYAYQQGDKRALEAVTTSLDHMARGGIYDQLGGGFARYATDEDWRVPHFEKMLYDNAQLVSIYAQAYQVTKDPLYREIIKETLAFVQRELTDAGGGFYSSLDADSEGEEGKFYTWTEAEIDSLLGDATMARLFKDYYQVTAKGNWEHTNILYRADAEADLLKKYGLTPTELDKRMQTAKTKLLAAREQRVRPGLDDKVLTAWNALMLKGYVDAYRALGEPSYLEAAVKNADFIVQNMLQADHRLYRNYKDGRAVINAFLDDYALTIQAFTALYEVTFEEKWLLRAKDLTDYTLTHFYDEDRRFFRYTSDLDPPLVAGTLSAVDDVIPNGNSVMARNLYTLGHYFYDDNYLATAKQLLHNVVKDIARADGPSYYSNWLHLYLDLLRPPYEVAIVGENYEEKLREISRYYLPHVLLLGGKEEGDLALLKNKLQEGETLIYVCQNKVCQLPVSEVEQALRQLKIN